MVIIMRTWKLVILLLLQFIISNLIVVFAVYNPENNDGNALPPIHPNISMMSLECADLQVGQYFCDDPDIDNETQQPTGCSKETQSVQVACYPVAGINCSGQLHTGETVGFHRDVPCKWTNGQKFSIALLLSVFLGMFGIDRFYLGYPAIGLLKLCTLGFMFLGQLVDILLIALQVVGPSDGSYYVIDYYGAVLHQVKSDNLTYIQPQYEEGYNYNYEL